MKIKIPILSTSIAALCLAAPAFSQPFFNHVRDAVAINADCHEITQDASHRHGAIWENTQINMNDPFEVQFTLNFGTNDANGADGMVFVFHADPRGTNAMGSLLSGGNLSYSDINDPPPATRIVNSLGIEFDTFDNDPGGASIFGDILNDQDHIAISENGNLGTPVAGPIAIGQPPANVETGADFPVRISWNPKTLTMTVNINGTILTHTDDLVTNVFGTNMVHWGITGSTAFFTNLQTVCFNQECDLPEFSVAIGTSDQTVFVDDIGNSVKAVPYPDCGYIVAGSRRTDNNTNERLTLTKTNEDGSIAWINEYNEQFGANEGAFNDVEVLNDGYALTGWIEVNSVRYLIILRTDNFGNPVWSKIYIQDELEMEGMDLEIACNGDYAVVGTYDNLAVLLRVRNDGLHLWGRSYGVQNGELRGISLEQTDDDGDGLADDGFVFCGTEQILNPMGARNWLVIKTNSTGAEMYSRVFAGVDSDEPLTIKQIDIDGDNILDNNQFAIGGYSTENAFPGIREVATLIRFSGLGAVHPIVRYRDSTHDARITGLELLNNGGFILGGHVDEHAGNGRRSAFLIETMPNGLINLQRNYGQKLTDNTANSVEITADGGYVFTGLTTGFGIPSPQDDLLLVKTDAQLNDPCIGYLGNFESTLANVASGIPTHIFGDIDTHYDETMIATSPDTFFADCSYVTQRKKSPTAGLSEMSEEMDEQFVIYPNPIKQGESIRIQLSADQDHGNVRVSLFNVMGQQVFTSETNQGGQVLQLDIPTKDLSKGVYLFSIQSNNGQETGKLVVE